MSSSCGSCGAAVVWCETSKGKRMPVDAEPYDGGNVEIVEVRGAAPLAVVHGDTGMATLDGSPRYRSHFATCPNADQHRRK